MTRVRAIVQVASANTTASALMQIYNYYDVDHNGTVTGANVKHMLFAVRSTPDPLVDVPIPQLAVSRAAVGLRNRG